MQSMKSSALAVILPALFFPASAQAQQLPHFDVTTHCKEVASFGGSYSAMLNNSCIDMEQDAYNHLKPVWGRLPGSMRDHCTEVAAFGGPGSYSLLESCVKMESDAASSQKTFRY